VALYCRFILEHVGANLNSPLSLGCPKRLAYPFDLSKLDIRRKIYKGLKLGGGYQIPEVTTFLEHFGSNLTLTSHSKGPKT